MHFLGVSPVGLSRSVREELEQYVRFLSIHRPEGGAWRNQPMKGEVSICREDGPYRLLFLMLLFTPMHDERSISLASAMDFGWNAGIADDEAAVTPESGTRDVLRRVDPDAEGGACRNQPT